MIEVTGMDGIKRRLEDLSRRARALDGHHQVRFSELMPPEFISNCSRFETLEALFAASNLKIESIEDFEAIPDGEWDTFIRENTSYGNWEEMRQDAIRTWAGKQLGLR